jgi:tetratricopeptide (TPR) repeat protein
VRHALRPYTTIIISEDQFKFPFDVNRNKILKYKHLGEDIGVGEAKRFAAQLKSTITEILAKTPPPDDSPVYTFLQGLRRLKLPDDMTANAQALAERRQQAAELPPGAPDQTHGELMRQVDEAQAAGNFEMAKALLTAVHALRPDDPYIVQRLALVTYKNKKQALKERFAEARALLATLNPATSNDTETLGLWGAVHKNLWSETRDTHDLDESIRGYERGFYLRNDHYNGINFAFLLNVRADHRLGLARASADSLEIARHRAEAIADFIEAERVRAEVLAICEQWLRANPVPREDASPAVRKDALKNRYWYAATKAEALLGMGRAGEAEQCYQDAYASAP